MPAAAWYYCWFYFCRLQLFYSRQPWHDRLLAWSCTDECAYQCMWKTVENVYRKNEIPVQQFYGKWPFVRLWGIQEPASAIFSIFNLMPHIYMVCKIVKKIPSETVMFPVWVGYSIVSINTWIWSTVFHTRDWEVTEKVRIRLPYIPSDYKTFLGEGSSICILGKTHYAFLY